MSRACLWSGAGGRCALNNGQGPAKIKRDELEGTLTPGVQITNYYRSLASTANTEPTLCSRVPSQWNHSMYDWWWNSTSHNNGKKKSTKDRICQLQWGNKNMGKQKDVGLIKNARHSSLICESGSVWKPGDKWNDWHVVGIMCTCPIMTAIFSSVAKTKG